MAPRNVVADLAEAVGSPGARYPIHLSPILGDHEFCQQLSRMGLGVEDIADAYPCSPLQEGIFLNSSSSYAVYWIWRCVPKDHGQNVSATRLSDAWKRATSRHGIFSTIVAHHPKQNGFLQLVLRNAPVLVSIVDCDSQECPAIVLEHAARPVFRANQPKVAVTICRSTSGNIACRFDVCHTIYDGYSLFVLLRDVLDLYAGSTTPKPNSFRSVIEHIEATPKVDTVGFWTEYLRGMRVCKFPVLLQSRGASELTDPPQAMSLPQHAFTDATSFYLDEVTFGYMASGRDVPVEGIDRICGPLANLVVNRVDLRQPLGDLIRSMGPTLKEHRRHQQTQLAEVRHKLGISDQLFNTAVNLLRPGATEPSESDEFVFEKHVSVTLNEFDLVLGGYLEPDTVRVTLYYKNSSLGFQAAAEVSERFTQAANFICSLEPRLQEIMDGSWGLTPELTSEVPERFFNYVAGQTKEEVLGTLRSHFEGCSPIEEDDCQPHVPKPKELHWTVEGLEMTQSHADTIITTAWTILLAQRSNSDQACFGVAFDVGSSELIASSAVPSRVLVDGNGSVLELMQAVERDKVCNETLRRTGVHKFRQFSEHTAIACNFQYLLLLNEDSKRPLGLIERNAKPQNYPIVARYNIQQHTIVLSITFDQDIFTLPESQKFGTRFANILRRLLRAPAEQRVCSLAVADDQDLQRIWRWNYEVPTTLNVPVTDLFEEQVRLRPQALAIHSWDGDFTYSEVDMLSTQLANVLLNKGVQPGHIIPLFFEKCKWMSISMLAAIKAGAAGACLDPHQPQSHLRTILDGLQPKIILSSANNENLVGTISASELVIVDGVFFENCGPQPPQHWPRIEPTGALYVVFTSGTTGKPKGVTVSHQNYSSAVSHQWKDAGFDSSSRVLDFASYAFDVAWFNLLHTMATGGCLCVPSDDEKFNDLANCFDKYAITIVFLTPSVVRHLGHRALQNLKTLVLLGEAVLASDIAPLRAEGELQIKIGYGPAECTPMATCFDMLMKRQIAIGKGLGACTWVVSLNEEQSLQPIGAVGELCLEGPIVGQGYLNDPTKTAESFIKDPEWLMRGDGTHPGRKGVVYRTGDLVKYEEDGTLVFIGRKDNQVKIRGQRVELQEIERHIQLYLEKQSAACDGETHLQAVVETIRHNDASILVAFIEAHGGNTKNKDQSLNIIKKYSNALFNHLKQTLPSYMVPAAFIPLSDMPLTINGKTNRALLRERASSSWQLYNLSSDEETNQVVLPVGQMEKTLQEIWANVLNLPQEELGTTTAFTRLGGDSITAMQIVSQCRKRGVLIKVRDMLQAETIQNVARRCISAASRTDQQMETESQNQDAGSTSGSFDLSPIQRKFFELFPEGLNHFNQGFILELNKEVAANTMHEALKAVIRRHGMLRARFEKKRSESWTQNIYAYDDSSFSYVVHNVASRAEVFSLAQQSQNQIDIINGPVFAVHLFNLECGQQLISFSAHHLVVDLVSWRIIWQDIEDYVRDGGLHDRNATSFQEWCGFQADAAQTLRPHIVLPLHIPNPDLSFWGLPPQQNTRNTSTSYIVELDAASTKLLLHGSNAGLRSEPIDIILGTYAYSFLQTFEERIGNSGVIFIERHGREVPDNVSADIAGTIGWFTTVYPVSMQITGNTSLTDAMSLAKDARRSVPGKGQPYFASRYYSEECREAFNSHDDIELLLNFGGTYQQLERTDGLFKLPKSVHDGNTLRVVSDEAKRMALIEANSTVQDGKLITTFTFNRNMRHIQRLKQWVESFNPLLSAAVQTLAKAEPM
ncbi:hypothetical protein NLG97_g867 [Lecanicillium saksenae]|uniref:Uncharacterized protein n=1 Tax=Lecanicillium saksenae TaxID=468837 RepID=A0ACC1R797_9HYPO|nr:hypothetical protein NLG97_g867 [Lecanicillium saksenae]